MLRYNICSAWFLDIRISTCFNNRFFMCCMHGVSCSMIFCTEYKLANYLQAVYKENTQI